MDLNLLDRWARTVTAELTIRRDTVELRCKDRLVGVADRDQMRQWLRSPAGTYAYDECAWLDLGHGGVALHVDDMVPAFVLSDAVVAAIRQHV